MAKFVDEELRDASPANIASDKRRENAPYFDHTSKAPNDGLSASSGGNEKCMSKARISSGELMGGSKVYW